MGIEVSLVAERLAPFLLGAIALGLAVVAVFFARYFRDTRDPLFLWFSAAFVLESVNRILFAFSRSHDEAVPALYLMRAAAYSLIAIAIYRKNRR